MSSENDTSINVCLLGNVKAGDLLGVGVQGHQFNFQSLMLFNLPGLHAIVSYIKIMTLLSSNNLRGLLVQFYNPADVAL